MPIQTRLPLHDAAYQRLIADAVSRYLPKATLEDVPLSPVKGLKGKGLTGKALKWQGLDEQGMKLFHLTDPQLMQVLRPPSFSSAVPHPVYELSLADIAAGLGLSAAQPIGWRYLVYCEDACVAAGHIANDAKTPARHHVMLNSGPFVEGTAAAIARAEALPALRQGAYTLALLSAPGVQVMALWLRPERAGDAAIFIPIEPKPDVLHRSTYAAADFEELLLALSQARLCAGALDA